jgi:hypothetical protein
MDIKKVQETVCNKYGTSFYGVDNSLKLGISRNFKERLLPINGLRIKPEGDTVGWYIWIGEELSNAPDFFLPLHVEHIKEWVPEIEKYLGLPPGWRFLLAGDYEDVWFDEELLLVGS